MKYRSNEVVKRRRRGAFGNACAEDTHQPNAPSPFSYGEKGLAANLDAIRGYRQVRALAEGEGPTALAPALPHTRYVAFTASMEWRGFAEVWGAVYSGIGDVRTVGARFLFERQF